MDRMELSTVCFDIYIWDNGSRTGKITIIWQGIVFGNRVDRIIVLNQLGCGKVFLA